jgi:hypothetical protein
MLTLSDFATEGPLLRLTWVDDLFDDTERVHVTPVEPILRCYNELLTPLAAARGEQLTEDEVRKAFTDKAAKSLFPSGSVDWLGLALYAQRRFLDAMGKLAEANTPEHRAEILAASPLRWVLLDLHIRMGWSGYPAHATANGQEFLDCPGLTPSPRY